MQQNYFQPQQSYTVPSLYTVVLSQYAIMRAKVKECYKIHLEIISYLQCCDGISYFEIPVEINLTTCSLFSSARDIYIS